VDVEELIRLLDAPQTDDADAAQGELMRRGRTVDVVAPLLRAVPHLSERGQQLAIEIFEQLDDQRAHQPLIEVLAGGNAILREWAASALGVMRVHEAVPALRRALQAGLDRGEPPDCSEQLALRWALADLETD
jgi:HEAT repeat protein